MYRFFTYEISRLSRLLALAIFAALIWFGLSASVAAAPIAPDFGFDTAPTRTTNNPRPAFQLIGTTGSTVDVFIDGVLSGSVVLRADATYTAFAPPTPLSDGPHPVYLVARDASGTSPPSRTLTVIVDTIAPPPPIITSPASGAVLSSGLFTMRGTGSVVRPIVRVSLNGVAAWGVINNVFGENNLWEFNSGKALLPGQYLVEAREVDQAGNQSPAATISIRVADFSAPAAPTLSGALRRNITHLGLVSGGAEPLSRVFLSVDGQRLTPITAGVGGAWNVDGANIALTEGPHRLDIYAENSAGRSPTTSVALVVDRTRPEIPVLITPALGSTFTDPNQVFSGTGEPGTRVILDLSGGCGLSGVFFSPLVDANGNWSATVAGPNLRPPSQTIRMGAVDQVGLRSGCINAATWRQTPTTAAPPTAAPVSAQVSSTQQAVAIPLSAAGVFSGFALAGAPAGHGTTEIRGGFAFYTPAPGFIGGDVFDYVATSFSGNSAPARVTVSIVAPPPPTAGPVSATVPFASTGVEVTLAPGGSFTTLQIATAPAHGSVTLQNGVALYVPASGYAGPDSFQYVAVGAGGQSAPGAVTITVAPPTVPGMVAPGYLVIEPLQAGAAGLLEVDLSSLVSSGVTGFQVVTAPNLGTVEIVSGGSPASFRLRYATANGVMGVDTFRLAAVGPGGTSSPVTFTVNVAGRAPDMAGTVLGPQPLVFLPLQGLSGGPFIGLQITRPPTTGQAAVDGQQIVFIPDERAPGPVEISYVVLLPFGQSGQGVIRIAGGPPPGMQDLHASTIAGRSVTVRITDGASGGPFTSAELLSMSPSDAGVGQIVTTGSAAAPAYDLTFAPAANFAGDAVLNLRLSNAFGTTEGRVTVTVEDRPDPSLDPDVRGMAAAHVMSAHRFAEAQSLNVQRRLERLRNGQNESANEVSLNFGPSAIDPRSLLPQFRHGKGAVDQSGRGPEEAAFIEALWPELADARTQGLQTTPQGQRAQDARGLGIWAAGSIDWVRDDQSGQRDRRVTTRGLTLGVDAPVGDRAIAGLAAGYGRDHVRIGSAGTMVEGESVTGMIYASVKATDSVFIDGSAGMGRFDLTSSRWAAALGDEPAAFAKGLRSGELLFASGSIGQQGAYLGARWTYFGRVDVGRIHLDAFTETGPAFASLSWAEMEQRSVSASLGATVAWTWDFRRYGVLSPDLRLEWERELEDPGEQRIAYADWMGGPAYLLRLDPWSQDRLRLAVGLNWRLNPVEVGASYRREFGDFSSSHGAEVMVRWAW